MKGSLFFGHFLILILLFVITLSFPFSAEAIEERFANSFNKKVLNLSLEEGKVMVLEKNLDIAIQQIVPRVEEERVNREKGSFDPSITGSFLRVDSTIPLTTRSSVAAGGRTIVESETYSVNTGISGKIPLGTEYSVEFEDVWTENTFNRFNAEYDAFAGIKITQPLLKNFGYDINRFDILIAQKNRDISISDLKQHITDTIADYKKAYWDLVRALEDHTLKEESLKLAESLLDLNRKRLKAEVTSPLEVTQAEAGVASRKEDLIIARELVKQRENALKRLISRDVYSLMNIEILPEDKPEIRPVTLDLEYSFQEGVENRPDYQKTVTEIEKKNISVQYAENQKFPSIDLEASYGLNGLGSSFNDSLEDLEDHDEWTLGVMVKFPLGNRTARGDLRIAQLEAEQELLNLKRLEQEILVEIDNAIRQVKTNKERIEAARISKKLAQESLDAEERKLLEGLSTSHNVLEFEEDLAEAKSREIRAIIDYNKSLVELSRVKGLLLKEEHITLDEH